MSWEVLKEVERAEAKAEDIRQSAQKEAREILKSAEEACAVQERNAALEHRALSLRILEDAKATARRRIEALEAEEAKKCAEEMDKARARLPEAAEIIYKRVVADGHR